MAVYQYGGASGAQQGAQAAKSVVGARTGSLSRPLNAASSSVLTYTDARDSKQAPARSSGGTAPTCPAGQKWTGFKCEALPSQRASGPVAQGAGTKLPDPVKQGDLVRDELPESPASCPKGMMPQVVSGVVKCAPVVGGAGTVIDKTVDKLVDAGKAVIDAGGGIVDAGVPEPVVVEPEVLPAGPLPASEAGMPTNVKIALGVGGALVLGGLVWMLARR